MVGELVFHLGDCKTGTTSIQAVLAGRAWRADRGEITYPTRFNHIPLAKTLSVPKERPLEEKRFTKAREALDASDAAYGVISAEHFEFVDPEKVHAAIHRHLPDYVDRLRLVAYVRPHADRFLSTFAERSKKGVFGGSLEEFHAESAQAGLLVYAPRFEKWRALFGDRFTLRPFIRDQLYRGDVVQDFFHYLFGSEGFEITRETDRNESLSVEDIAMMRAIHRRIRRQSKGLGPAQQAFGWYMSNFLGATPSPGGTKPRLHRALAERIVETYRADAEALDAEFFEGTPMADALAAAPGKAVDAAQSFELKDYFGPAERRRVRVWADFVLRLMESDPEHFMWAVRDADQRPPQPPRAREGGAA